MASRRKKPTSLSPAEVERFLAAATELHRACTDPLIAPSSQHYAALSELNAAVVKAFREVTGQEAPWISRGSYSPY